MPSPMSTQVHVDRPLSALSVAYMQDHADYIADKVFGVVPVQKQSDRYFLYSKADFLRDEAQLRAPATESAGGGYNIDNTPTYYAPVYAWHQDIDPQIRANSDQPLDADRDATIYCTEKILLKRERLFLTNYFTTGVWLGSSTGSDITPGTLWSAANSTPIADIETERFAVKRNGTRFPNVLVLGSTVFSDLKTNDDIVQRVKYTSIQSISTDLLARLFEVDRVLVTSAVENTAHEGVTTPTMAFMASSKDALLCYANPNPGIMQPSAGYIFAWVNLEGAAGLQARVSNIPTPLLGQGANRIEAEIAFDAKVVGADMGSYFSGAVA